MVKQWKSAQESTGSTTEPNLEVTENISNWEGENATTEDESFSSTG